ncbi:amidohydrolase [Plantibacter sp. YIM 135347]|uniref:amidohydrolase n=1 Tax=Plantibacter sp. YIM 135347 TaxID=3423919 RepID=UPI003D35943C
MVATIYSGTFITMDEDHPEGEAMLVVDDRIVAVGALQDVRAAAPDDAIHTPLDGWVLPGLVEPHGHPTNSAVFLSEDTLDIRPVTLAKADEVRHALGEAIAAGPETLFANGWDPLLQRGLETPDRASLDRLAGPIPLVILHNSGHSAYFNSAAAALAGIDRTTPDPPGASYGRDASGELNGIAFETAAVTRLVMPVAAKAFGDFGRIFAEYCADLNRRGYTTVSDLGWDPSLAPAISAVRANGGLTIRLRLYAMSKPGVLPSERPDERPDDAGDGTGGEDALVRQVGVKTWSDGSPWVGNIATTFPYLDTPATRAIGLEPHHIGTANFSREQLIDIGDPHAAAGWQLACHAHGDRAISDTLDAYEELITRHDLVDHRFRLEHVGAMTPAQFERAAALGVTTSVFVDHLYYWGDVLVDDLFGEEHGAAWADAGAAFAAGIRATFHNDGWVTPNEPFRNMSVAMTRRTRSGRRLDRGTVVDRADALRAHTSNAAWQVRSDHEIGALRPGLFADFITVDRDPRTADPELLAHTVVTSTYLGGARVA